MYNNASIDLKFDSIKSILEYFGCKYKKKKVSDIEGFETDIYTVFKYDLYDGEEKNEKFYVHHY